MSRFSSSAAEQEMSENRERKLVVLWKTSSTGQRKDWEQVEAVFVLILPRVNTQFRRFTGAFQIYIKHKLINKYKANGMNKFIKIYK